MGKKKKIREFMKSYEEAKFLHKKKIEELKENKPHLREYWEKEIREMDRKILEAKRKLKYK